jgi:hypothetical protein
MSQSERAPGRAAPRTPKSAPAEPNPACGHPHHETFASNCVTVFGGGVTGLTIAHELVERQFRVQVWEPQTDERYPNGGCDVGGMARTQWARVQWPDSRDLNKRPGEPSSEWHERSAEPIVTIPHTFYVQTNHRDPNGPIKICTFDDQGNLSTGEEDWNKKVAREGLDILRDNERIDFVYCEVQRRLTRDEEASLPSLSEAALQPHLALDETELKRAVGYYTNLVEGMGATVKVQPLEYRWQRNLKLWLEGRDEPITVVVVPLDGFPEGVPEHLSVRVTFRVRERWLPGEHGFRFFPAFYHHLFDTMKRTPILEPVEKAPTGAAQERSVTVNPNPQKYVDTGATVFDNLRPTTKIALGMTRDGRPSIESRSAPVSLEDIRQWLRLFFGAPGKGPPPTRRAQARDWERDDSGGFGCTLRDAMRFEVKVLKYLTSCAERRKEYEHMTWLDFLGGQNAYSKEFVKMTNKWPEALIAMDARTIDARSHGSVLMQFILDNVRTAGYRDGTLAGPTSEVWLKPWRRYLEAQGVEFIQGKLVGFESLQLKEMDRGGDVVSGAGQATPEVIWPKVQCHEPRYPMNEDGQPALMPGYFVLALPVEQAKEMAIAYLEASAGRRPPNPDSDIARLARFGLPPVDHPKPNGALRHMIGIQYYFDEDLSWFDGHIYFPESEWGISAVSQIRFWHDRPDWEHGYRGILSVIYSMTIDGNPNWDAWGAPPDVVAKKVWDQISEALPNIPEPRHWHIDGNVTHDKSSVLTDEQGKERRGGYVNRSPYLINLPNEWTHRPGKLALPDTQRPDCPCGYEVNERIVLAGTYMKTYTRLTTMEAANESARHAVNGILSHSRHQQKVSYCDVWPLEDREVDDFRMLKDLDEELYRRGLDHFVDILDVDEVAAHALRGGPSDPFDVLGVLRGMGQILRQYGPSIIDLLGQRPND